MLKVGMGAMMILCGGGGGGGGGELNESFGIFLGFGWMRGVRG